MKNIQNLIAYICNRAIECAGARGLDYAENYISPKNWEMKCFRLDGKKRYILWNAYFYPRWSRDIILYDVDAPVKIPNLPEFLRQNYVRYDDFVGSSPEEAFEKWIEDLFNGAESLNSIRMRAAIEGNIL